jgi:hypothetical protein
MSRIEEGNQYSKIPEGPKSDLGAYLYKTLLARVIPGIISTSAALEQFAGQQPDTTARKMRSALGRLPIIASSAAKGQLIKVNIEIVRLPHPETADTLASRISKVDSEIYPLPSSITRRIHNPRDTVSDGMARESLVHGLVTVVTEVSPPGSNRRLYTVRLAGRARLREEQ